MLISSLIHINQLVWLFQSDHKSKTLWKSINQIKRILIQSVGRKVNWSTEWLVTRISRATGRSNKQLISQPNEFKFWERTFRWIDHFSYLSINKALNAPNCYVTTGSSIYSCTSYKYVFQMAWHRGFTLNHSRTHKISRYHFYIIFWVLKIYPSYILH